MTKKDIAWVTDSTAFITEEFKNNPDVYVVPLRIVFGEEVFEDGIDLTTDQLYNRINNQKELPKTSQPSVGRFVELFEKLKLEYNHTIAVHISAKLSGTVASCTAAVEISQYEVEVVDSKCMSYTITTLINKGMELAKQGINFKDIAKKLRQETQNAENYMVLGNLEQFYKGGRMSGTQYLLGSILSIKPIIQINTQGEFMLFEKVRSEAKAFKRMLDLFHKSYDNYKIPQLQIMHGNVLTKATELKKEFLKFFPNLDIFIGEISSTIAVHAGEGTIALIWHNEEK
ncbi:MAG: DegV family protein [Vulcanibacillus sp.]